MMLVHLSELVRSVGLDGLGPALASAGQGVEQTSAAVRGASEPTLVWPGLLLVVRTGIGIITLGIVLCLYRILRGPHLADRVLAGDVLSLMLVALIILLMIETDNTVFIDAALVVAIIGFASTVAFAQYIGARPGQGDSFRKEPREGAEGAEGLRG